MSNYVIKNIDFDDIGAIASILKLQRNYTVLKSVDNRYIKVVPIYTIN